MKMKRYKVEVILEYYDYGEVDLDFVHSMVFDTLRAREKSVDDSWSNFEDIKVTELLEKGE